MKKFLLTSVVAVSFFVYVAYSKHVPEGTVIPPAGLQLPAQTAGNSTIAAGSSPTPTPTPTSTPRPTSVARSVPAPTPTPVQRGRYKDGTFVGSIADAYYGNVQVEAIIQNGKIANVRFLQYPNDRSTSREINSQAMPYLIAEAVQVQNANVDIISGATDTSQAFQQSLGSALSQAG